ncbi:hypothetical protein BN7_1752 [Wickerhamomyces ciferrii]|uniref:U3 small nucleolar RNA-associated protein 22 n=1 Tax=Wickerhamomyces ciferrii (strain ATCC 14091 / BCRC 22168 / CBS 111 / JCM 3599 / NBRC 0793 / NRRL Y-1031 F-60-10) TaxID=1206466 RepID=K0KM58_WICCF|nr:uncharacterized protein BN7_1752 [Wickerhamomyces ciferrii]CCH42208.1 hypothetical protein BN7_1752 [Wickerhamomyces ciferrii]
MAKRTREQEIVEDVQPLKKSTLTREQLIKKLTKKDVKEDSDEDVADEPESDQIDDDEDEDESEGDEDEEETNGQEVQQSGKKNKSALSAQEVQIARETAELFKSNIFKLQIDELIKEVKLKDTKVAKIEKFLHKLYDMIQTIPDLKEHSLEDAELWFKSKKTTIPYNDPKPTNINYKFGYSKPENTSIIGSFGLKTAIQSPHGLSIDVNVTMPKELLQAKDYLNYRALHKRSFYLGYLTENLKTVFKKEGLDFLKLSYTYLNDDILTPVLKIQALNINQGSEYNFYKTKFSINVLVGFPFGVFDAKKLLPNKNCIRVQKNEELELPPTSLYNASILTMTSYDQYLKYLYKTKKSADQFKEACILGRLWLSQRGLNSTMDAGGFGHFEFAVLTAALLNGGGANGNKILLHGFSSYQLFKGVIKYIAEQDLLTDGHLQFYSDSNDSTKYIKGGFNTPTIFDKSTKLNILHKVTKNSYTILVHHAKKTLALLNDVVVDRFDSLFLKNSNIDYLKYDFSVNFQLSPNGDAAFGPFEKITFLTYENYIANKVSTILRYGLGDRVRGIDVRFERTVEFDTSKRKPSSQESLNVIVGILVNPNEAEKLVTKGPNDSEDSTQFRSFWGPKSSLRRFKDGNITHSVIWSNDYKEPIILSIIDYILKTHIREDLKIESNITNINKLLPLPNLPSSTKQSVVSTNSYNSLLRSYDTLYKILFKLELPLSIRSILPISPALRYTSYLQPVPFAVSNNDFFNDLVLQFETSTKWPDEISALEKVKTAFLLKINEILSAETAYKSYLTKEENIIPYNFDITTLNILTPEGYGFKLRVLTERDETLYLRAVGNAKKEKKHALDSIYFNFKQNYQDSVTHTRTISSLSHQFQYYSPTVRLFKKWLDDQLLLSHLSEELVELIALKPFVDPGQFDVPSSVSNGFLRILHFISQWNWKEEPLILDLSKKPEDEEEANILSKLSDRLTVQSHQQIKSNFEKVRKEDPQGLKTQFFVGTKLDPSGITWSHNLSLPIATRLTALSKVAIQLINNNGLNKKTLDLLFTPSLGDYDFVINLKSIPLTTSSGILPNTSAFKNLLNTSNSYPSDITSKFNPIRKLIQELNSKFEGTIIFSYHSHTLSESGENVITGLFVPSKLQNSKFKVQLGYNFEPVTKDEVKINKKAIFNEILNVAGDLVAGFQTRH